MWVQLSSCLSRVSGSTVVSKWPHLVPFPLNSQASYGLVSGIHVTVGFKYFHFRYPRNCRAQIFPFPVTTCTPKIFPLPVLRVGFTNFHLPDMLSLPAAAPVHMGLKMVLVCSDARGASVENTVARSGGVSSAISSKNSAINFESKLGQNPRFLLFLKLKSCYLQKKLCP